MPEVLPPAYAIINAKQLDCGYPFKDLSGVGIAFKLCQALEQREPGRLPEWQGLTELAALGTVRILYRWSAKTVSWCAVD